MDEAGELVTGEEGLLQRRVARDREVLGVRENALDHDLGVALLAQDRGTVLRVLVERRVHLVVEVVEERGHAPELLVLPVVARVPAYGRLDRERVTQERLALRVTSKRVPGLVTGRFRHVR